MSTILTLICMDKFRSDWVVLIKVFGPLSFCGVNLKSICFVWEILLRRTTAWVMKILLESDLLSVVSALFVIPHGFETTDNAVVICQGSMSSISWWKSRYFWKFLVYSLFMFPIKKCSIGITLKKACKSSNSILSWRGISLMTAMIWLGIRYVFAFVTSFRGWWWLK